MRFLRKWRSFRFGKYKLALNEKRTIHSGAGHKTGCGLDVVETSHVFYVDGVQTWKKVKSYRVDY